MHLVTGEYPPQFGGVSDYTLAVASGLSAAGWPVHVWCPAAQERLTPTVPGVAVHRIAGRWTSADLARIDAELDRIGGPRRLIVQWVPHAFGRRSLNVGFCLWVRRRAARGDQVELMVHEAFLGFGEGNWKHSAAAAVQRLMAALLLSRAQRVWVSIPAWADLLRPYCVGRATTFEWLPVPSNIPRTIDRGAVSALRQKVAPEASVLIGHFGTYESQVRRALASLIPSLLARDGRRSVLLIGRDSDSVRSQLAASNPAVADRLAATGLTDSRGVSLALQACDLLVQPYPDGASSRRTSLMAALAHGVPVVTTDGRLSDPLWRTSRAVRLVPAGDDAALLEATLAVCNDSAERRRLAEAGQALYSHQFDLANTIAALEAQYSRPAA